MTTSNDYRNDDYLARAESDEMGLGDEARANQEVVDALANLDAVQVRAQIDDDPFAEVSLDDVSDEDIENAILDCAGLIDRAMDATDTCSDDEAWNHLTRACEDIANRAFEMSTARLS